MPSPTMVDAAMDTPKKGWQKKKDFKPGGQKGKLHRELGVPTDESIPATKLVAALHSSKPEVKRDAVRAKTMEGWNHGGKKRSLYKD